MGVGRPQDILAAVRAGFDLFDCVIPTRNGRNGALFTWQGKLSIKRAEFAEFMAGIPHEDFEEFINGEGVC